MRRLLLAALLLAPAVLAAPAGAATVSQVIRDSCAGDPACSKFGGGVPVPVTSIVGAPGETNSVSVSRDGDSWMVADAASALQVAAPCTVVDPSTARCPFTEGRPAIPGLEIDAGDGDDAVTITGDPRAESTILGGPGADTVTGGDGNDTIDGGPGSDHLAGGGGFNTLTYEARKGDVTVDLRKGHGGETGVGEDDVVSGFGTLLSGRGTDVLNGSVADETIDGGPGADFIDGRGGDDALFGNTGPDALKGGPGDDRLFGDPEQGDGEYTPIIRLADDFLEGGSGDDQLDDTGGRNRFFGGPGRDTIDGGAGRDRVKGGPGNDKIDTRGGSRDRVDCGAGRRDRAKTDRRKDARRHCERR
jgi:Ca2+-binding RTX toxin-like protein